jgi:sugar-specific transcriptional regulator TrmB
VNLAEKLEGAGLDKKEAAVYLAVLEIGPASISDIAKKATIKRPTTYHYIEGLAKRGLIYKTSRGKRTLYNADDPQKLATVLEEKKRNIEKLIPELQSLYLSAPKQPRIKFYEGKEGIMTVYEEIFNTTQIIYAVFSPEKFFEVFTKEEDKRFSEILKTAGGRIHNLLELSEKAKEFVKYDYYKGIERSKFLPEDIKFSTDILIAGDKVAMISFQNLTAVIIQNEEIADTLRVLLKFIWKIYKPI